MQTVVVLAPAPLIIAALPTVIAVVAMRRHSLSSLFRWTRGLMLILTVVLVSRSLVSPFSEVFVPWLIYALRLFTSVGIAFVLNAEIGLVSIVRTVSCVADWVPHPSLRQFITDTLKSVIFLFPVISSRLRSVREAYTIRRVRLKKPSGSLSHRWTGRLLLTSVSSIAAIPRARAEALLLRDPR